MALMDWIPKFIQQVLDRPPRYKVTSEEYNSLFNLIIEQGDHNTLAIQNLRDEIALKLATTEAESVYATQAALAGVVVGAIPPGTITEDLLAFEVVTEAELTAALEDVGGGTGVTIVPADMTGTTGTDGLASTGSAMVANTSTSAAVVLAEATTVDLPMGLLSVILRMRSANNVSTVDTIKVEVFKMIGTTETLQTTKNFKPTVFDVTTDFENLYVLFEYKGGLATNNEIIIRVTLLTAASVFAVALDSITILPSTIGIVDM